MHFQCIAVEFLKVISNAIFPQLFVILLINLIEGGVDETIDIFDHFCKLFGGV